MRLLKHIYNGLSITILAVACILLLLFGWSKTGWKALTIPTGSMRPSMPPGTLVLVHGVPDSSLKVGDVITYISPIDPQLTITHRIIKKELIAGAIPGFVTRGDASRQSDPPIVAGRVVGKVVAHIPNLGYWLVDLQKPIVILPIIYVASLFIIIEEVGRLSEYYRFGQTYRLRGFSVLSKNQGSILHRRLGYLSSFVAAVAVVSFVATPTVLALLKSNTVSLTNNRITVASIIPINQCSGNATNNTSINVTNNTSQSATSGDATASGNGSATSGDASNSSSTSFSTSVSNC
jgi:signal peptidase I